MLIYGRKLNLDVN